MTKARDLANAATALSAVTATELAFVDGVTSAIQTQIDGKQAVNANVSTTELGYLDGVTSAIQTQLDTKLASSTAATTYVPNSLADAKGDLLTATADNTPARLAVGSNGETIVADSSTSTGLRYTGNYAAGKNKIINGDFGVWQRGTSFVASVYTADRWFVDCDGTTKTITQQTFTPGTAPVAGYEGTYFLRLTKVAGSYGLIKEQIEDVRTLAGQTVTLSFWAKASATVTVDTIYTQDFGSGGSAQVAANVGSPALTTSWQRFTYSFAMPSVSGKTIGAGSSVGIQPIRYVNAGNLTVDLWGVQLEAGSVATAFQTATGTIQGELAACLYYFNRLAGEGTGHQISNGQCWSSTEAMATINYPTMRVAPTITYSTNSWFSLQNATNTEVAITALASYNIRKNSYKPNMTVASGLVAGNACTFQTRSTGSTGTLDLSAEL